MEYRHFHQKSSFSLYRISAPTATASIPPPSWAGEQRAPSYITRIFGGSFSSVVVTSEGHDQDSSGGNDSDRPCRRSSPLVAAAAVLVASFWHNYNGRKWTLKNTGNIGWIVLLAAKRWWRFGGSSSRCEDSIWGEGAIFMEMTIFPISSSEDLFYFILLIIYFWSVALRSDRWNSFSKLIWPKLTHNTYYIIHTSFETWVVPSSADVPVPMFEHPFLQGLVNYFSAVLRLCTKQICVCNVGSTRGCQEDTRKSGFRSERGSESKAIQNKTISGARVFLATRVFVTQIWERGFFLAPRVFLPK